MNLEDIMTSTTISAVTAIVVVVLGDLLSGIRILRKLDKHHESSFKSHEELSSSCKQLESDHEKLLEGNNQIKIDSKLLLNYSEKIGGKIDQIDKTLTEEKFTKKQQYESLSDKQREIKNSIDKLSGFSDEFQRISLLNSKLMRELNDMQAENDQLRLHNRKLRDKIDDLERDEEYER